MSADVLRQVSWGNGLGSPGSPNTVSTYSIKDGRIKRPKSTPASIRVTFPTSNGSPTKMNRPKTAAAALVSTCDRVSQVEHEPIRRHNFETHIPLKKSRPPPWQNKLDQPLVPFVVGPGYILSRSKTKYTMTIKEEFFDPVQDETARKKQDDSERDNLIAQLQQQISDLTLYLEEERLNHRQTKQKAEEFLKDKIEELQNQHRDHVRELEEDHQEEIEQTKKQLNMEHGQYRASTDAQINRMKKEIEFLQGAFESYKSSLHQEMDEKWKKRETELEQQLEDQKQQSLQDIRNKLIQERNAEKIALGKEHQKAMENQRKEHKKELDALIRKFTNVASDLERLKKATTELEELKAEYDQIKLRYDETCQQLANTTRMLTDTKVRLLAFEEQFEDKVQEVDEKYKQKIHDLMTQNTELRRMYVKKCGDLFDEKAMAEVNRISRVSSAKEVMHSLLKSKHKADVSFAPGDPALENRLRPPKVRPGSAPVTRGENEQASLSAGETRNLRLEDDDVPVQPLVTLPESSPELEEMRRQLMEDVKSPSRDQLLNAMDSV